MIDYKRLLLEVMNIRMGLINENKVLFYENANDMVITILNIILAIVMNTQLLLSVTEITISIAVILKFIYSFV